MNAIVDRLIASLAGFGEPILIGETEVLTFVRTYSPAEARVYLDTEGIDTAARPLRGFFVAPDTEVAVGDVITWLSEAYDVQFVRRYRLSGEDVGLGVIAFPA